ncbi:hypothetical protein MMC28_007283 [Mycoblastus sanguinarius]|nr:hypothetical protein [Mycoblastus sanguinarius]
MDVSKKKRRVISDFFTPVAKSQVIQDLRHNQQPDQEKESSADLASHKAAVPGLSVYASFINPAEEQRILAFLNDPSRCTWRTDLSRRTMHFGGTYCLMPSKSDGVDSVEAEILQAPPMPEELSWLIQRMVDASMFSDNQRPQYCIVNEYTGNMGIAAHTENFQFGEPVVGLSLLSDCPIRFHELARPSDGSVRSGKAGKAEKTGRKLDVFVSGRSLLVMRGESRWKWQHEILRSKKGRGAGWKRISLTFRYKSESSKR